MPAPSIDGTAVLGEAINTSGTHTFASGKTTAGSNRLGIVAVGAVSFGSVGITGVTWGGVAMTVAAQLKPDMAAALWYLVNPPTGSSTVVITVDGLFQGWGVVASYQDVNPLSPLGGIVTASGAGSTATINVASAVGDLVIDALGYYSTSPSVGGGQSEVSKGSNSGGDRWGGHSSEAGAATVTMSWTGSGSIWSMVAASLKPVKSALADGNVLRKMPVHQRMVSHMRH